MTYVMSSRFSIDKLFDEVFKDFPVSFVRSQYDGYPVSNVLANPESGNLKIELAVTGYDEDDIEVSLDDRILIVRGKIKTDYKKNHKGYEYIHQRIKEQHDFERRFSLPRELNLDKIEVRNKNGLLTIDIEYETEKTSEKKLKINK